MFESERYRTEIDNELDFKKMVEILNDIEDFENKWGFRVKDFFITGGDPVLNQDYKKLFEELKRRNKRIYVMGNPETLTPEVLEFFKEVGVIQMQMSLDGLKETHDFYRGKGSFDLTVKALEILDEYGITGTIMFTLTAENKDELVPLMNYLAYNTKAKGFAFDLVCGVGNARDISDRLSKEDVKKYFELYLAEKKKLRAAGNPMRVSEKSKFFQLIHYENDNFYPYDTDDFAVTGGCYVGFTCYTILADGSVAACRRFPTIIGKMPEQKMEDIFLANDLLKKFRRAESFETCGKCRFFKSCRGCPAVTYGYSEDPFSDNPLCFKDLLNRKVEEKDWPVVSLNTTKQEEADIVRSMLHNQYGADYNDFIENEEVLLLIGTLLGDKNERKNFFSNPDEYVRIMSMNIGAKEVAYVCYYVECVMQNRIPNPIKYSLDL